MPLWYRGHGGMTCTAGTVVRCSESGGSYLAFNVREKDMRIFSFFFIFIGYCGSLGSERCGSSMSVRSMAMCGLLGGVLGDQALPGAVPGVGEGGGWLGKLDQVEMEGGSRGRGGREEVGGRSWVWEIVRGRRRQLWEDKVAGVRK